MDKRIREGLNGDIPPPDPDAKRRAIAMARAEFVAEHAQATEKQKEKESQKSPQGFLAWLRLIVGNNADKEGDMKRRIYDNVMLFTILATIGLAYASCLNELGRFA